MTMTMPTTPMHLPANLPASPPARPGLPDVPDGQSRGVDAWGDGHDTVLLVRQGAQLHAWLDRCPHHGTPLAWRRHAYLNAAATRIVCHAHGAAFQIDTGRCTLGPCLGQGLTPVAVLRCADGAMRLGPRPGPPDTLETSA